MLSIQASFTRNIIFLRNYDIEKGKLARELHPHFHANASLNYASSIYVYEEFLQRRSVRGERRIFKRRDKIYLEARNFLRSLRRLRIQVYYYHYYHLRNRNSFSCVPRCVST